jgi:hypothetical protein
LINHPARIIMNKFLGYYFRKKDPNRPTSFNLKAMHIINRIAILLFLISLIIYLIKKYSS